MRCPWWEPIEVDDRRLVVVYRHGYKGKGKEGTARAMEGGMHR